MASVVLEARRRQVRDAADEPAGAPAGGLDRLFAPHRRTHDVGAEEAHRLRREYPGAAIDEGERAPLVVATEGQAGEDTAAEHRGPDPVAAPADAVEDVVPAPEAPEERQAVRGAVDRPAPVLLDRHVGEHRVEPAEVRGGQTRA